MIVLIKPLMLIICNRVAAKSEAQLSLSDRTMRLVSSNLANYHATVQKLLIRQVVTKRYEAGGNVS